MPILNLLQLVVVAFLPFPTAVLARAFSGAGGTLAGLGLSVAST